MIARLLAWLRQPNHDPVVDQALLVSHWRRYPPRQFIFPRQQPDGEPTPATEGLRNAVDWESLS